MKASKGWLMLPLVLAVSACAGDAEDEAVVVESETTTPAAMPPATPPGMAAGQTATLAAVGNSGVGGEATITDRGQETEVMVRLTGAPPSGTHAGHVHAGTCAAVGSVVQALSPITTDATGSGTMTMTIPVPAMTVMNGQHVVQYHGAGGTPIACADIPMHAM